MAARYTRFIDIMLDESFYTQLPYRHNAEYDVSFRELNEIEEYVVKKCPTLRGKNFKVKFTNDRLIR